MLKFSGKRNFHNKHTRALLAFSFEDFASVRMEVWYETDIYQVYEGRCFSTRMQGGRGELCR